MAPSKLVLALSMVSCASLAPKQVRVDAPQAAVGRRSVFSSVASAGAAAIGFGAMGANAYEGVYSMEIVKASDAVLDQDALSSPPVKKALDEFKGYAIGIVKLSNELKSNDQYDVAAVLKKDYDFVKVRATFNALTVVWDEDTQKGVDRITRGILQDLVETEAAAKFSDKGTRSAKKIALTQEKLTKLDGSFRKLFSYLVSDK